MVERCSYCHPHADPRKQRLCHVGATLFELYKVASIRYADMVGQAEPPVVSTEQAREARDEARRKYRAHTDGE